MASSAVSRPLVRRQKPASRAPRKSPTTVSLLPMSTVNSPLPPLVRLRARRSGTVSLLRVVGAGSVPGGCPGEAWARRRATSQDSPTLRK